MPDLEKAIQWLEIERECVGRDCDRDCGQCDLAQDRETLLSACDDALSLLKAQELRVLTLEEIDNIICTTTNDYERLLWAEARSKTRSSFGILQLDIDTDNNYEALLIGCSWPVCYRRETYGVKWRCWSARPTDEKRRDTPWQWSL
jgi:hypothetical protein